MINRPSISIENRVRLLNAIEGQNEDLVQRLAKNWHTPLRTVEQWRAERANGDYEDAKPGAQRKPKQDVTAQHPVLEDRLYELVRTTPYNWRQSLHTA